ncbi:MAG: TlpA family protein disulfide reductase, partial [Acidimicrobiaceae bacterium]|nr:TlpA family protein disulfide reductase [Acidimicrobiaceae bacterium]
MRTVAEPGVTPTRRAAGRRSAGRSRWVGGAVALAMAALVSGLLLFRSGGAPGAGTAPAVSGPTAGGGHYSLGAERGHWVLVNFFASWCTDCKAELAQLADLEHRHPAGLSVVSVD